MDLGSTNKTFINVSAELQSILFASLSWLMQTFVVKPCVTIFQESPVEPQRYYELFEKDTIKFGNSRYAMRKLQFWFSIVNHYRP